MVTKLADKGSFTEKWRERRGNGSMRLGHAPWMLVVTFLLMMRTSCAYNEGSSWRNKNAFVALKGDGTVRAWGDASRGGTAPSDLGGDVKVIYSTSNAFAALKGDGTVRAWGDRD